MMVGMMRRLGVPLVVVSCLWSSTALGQDGGQQQRADELFEEGRKLLAQEQYDQACSRFNEAIKLDPEAPGTLLNLGLCNEKLGKYATALYWFRKAQFRASEAGIASHEEAAKEHTADLATKVATVRIEFVSRPPPGTKVKIDDREVSEADLLRAEVDPGSHTLVAGAPGHKIFEQSFTIAGRGGDTITIELIEGDSAIIVDRGKGRRTAALYLAIGGGVLWGATTAVALIARSRYFKCVNGDGDFEPTLATCPHMNDPVAARDYANSQRDLARYVGTSLFAGGALAVSGAILLYVTAPKVERLDRTVFVPTVGPNDVGFAVSGRF
jgi:hypothetical protein